MKLMRIRWLVLLVSRLNDERDAFNGRYHGHYQNQTKCRNTTRHCLLNRQSVGCYLFQTNDNKTFSTFAKRFQQREAVMLLSCMAASCIWSQWSQRVLSIFLNCLIVFTFHRFFLNRVCGSTVNTNLTHCFRLVLVVSFCSVCFVCFLLFLPLLIFVFFKVEQNWK